MDLAKIKACICEGASEAAIIDILLDNELLIFQRGEMLDEGVIRCRDGKNFETRYLRKGFKDLIIAPEIEMLIILNENKYNEFKKTGKKPSIFCKENLKMSSVKSYDFVKNYFSKADTLVKAIKKYSEITKNRKGEYTLLDLLK